MKINEHLDSLNVLAGPEKWFLHYICINKKIPHDHTGYGVAYDRIIVIILLTGCMKHEKLGSWEKMILRE